MFLDIQPTEGAASMVVSAAMTMLCTMGIGFYIRFFVAMLRECKPKRIGYLILLRTDSAEHTIPPTKTEASLRRVA
jgi:hypothetical protein